MVPENSLSISAKSDCPLRGMGEKPQLLGEDFSMLEICSITESPVTRYMILISI